MDYENLNNETLNDDDEIVLIDYYDRIHQQMIHGLPVTKKVARFMENNKKKTRRKQNDYDYYTRPLEKFDEEDPDKMQYFIDENSDIEKNLELAEREKLEELDKEHKTTIIENAMIALTPEQQEVVIMAYYKNMTYSEIAKALNVSKPAIYARMHNAVKNIRKFVENGQN